MSTTERKSGACIFRDIGFNAAPAVQEKVTVYHIYQVYQFLSGFIRHDSRTFNRKTYFCRSTRGLQRIVQG